MTPVQLTKMSGAGNDFLVLGREAEQELRQNADWIRRVCRRRLSVGADGVLFVQPLGSDRVRVEFRNPDGSAAFCGNGTRCAARYAALQGWTGNAMVLETAIGEIPAVVEGERVRLTLPPPRDLGCPSIQIEGETLSGRHVDAGVPHFVVASQDLAGAPLQRWGPRARRHGEFGAEGVNVTLVEQRSRDQVRVRTWERGVEAETLACGSGAVAAALAARLAGAAERLLVVPASGVAIHVALPGPREEPLAAVVSGDARVIFEGKLGADAARGFEVR